MGRMRPTARKSSGGHRRSQTPPSEYLSIFTEKVIKRKLGNKYCPDKSGIGRPTIKPPKFMREIVKDAVRNSFPQLLERLLTNKHTGKIALELMTLSDHSTPPVRPELLGFSEYCQRLHPTDLSTVQEKLKAGEYDSGEELFTAMNQVFQNIIEFFPEDHKMYSNAEFLQAALSDFYKRWDSNLLLKQDKNHQEFVMGSIAGFQTRRGRSSAPVEEPGSGIYDRLNSLPQMRIVRRPQTEDKSSTRQSDRTFHLPIMSKRRNEEEQVEDADSSDSGGPRFRSSKYNKDAIIRADVDTSDDSESGMDNQTANPHRPHERISVKNKQRISVKETAEFSKNEDNEDFMSMGMSEDDASGDSDVPEEKYYISDDDDGSEADQDATKVPVEATDDKVKERNLSKKRKIDLTSASVPASSMRSRLNQQLETNTSKVGGFTQAGQIRVKVEASDIESTSQPQPLSDEEKLQLFLALKKLNEKECKLVSELIKYREPLNPCDSFYFSHDINLDVLKPSTQREVEVYVAFQSLKKTLPPIFATSSE